MALHLSLPNEIALLICCELDDADLLTLCQTSRLFNNLALVVFFARHRVSSENTVSATSASLPGIRLALTLPQTDKLSCTFDDTTAESDVSALTRFTSRVPPIRDVEVKIGGLSEPASDRPRLAGRLLHLLVTLLPDHSSTLLILRCGDFSVSRRRHVYPRLEDFLPTVRVNNACTLVVLVGLFLLSQKLLDLATIVCDPLARRHQTDRIRNDLERSSCPTSIHITHGILTTPGCSKWILVAFDQDSITHLSISANPSLRSQWPSLLSTLTFPSLTGLTIFYNVRLPFPTLSSFLKCNPSINSLTLENFSVTYTDLSPLPVNSLPHLQYLVAPTRHVLNILRDSQSAAGMRQWRDLYAVGFAPRVSTYRRSDLSMRSDSPFNANEFDEALGIVAGLHNRLNHSNFTLLIQIPGGSKAKAWFTAMTEAYGERVERKMYHVSSVTFCTEAGRPLHEKLLPLLPRWLGLFPNVKQVWIGEYVVQTETKREWLRREVHIACPNLEHVMFVC